MVLYFLKYYYLKAKIKFLFNSKKSNLFDSYFVKWNRIKIFASLLGNDCDLVETGTYYGLTVDACLNDFNNIYTIELNEGLFKFNIERFKHQNNVNILQGDSSVRLKELLHSKSLNKNCVFWLDGHYSDKETSLSDKVSPIIAELLSIFEIVKEGYNWIILIDDLRLFDGIEYPSFDEIKQLALDNNFMIEKEGDCIILRREISFS